MENYHARDKTCLWSEGHTHAVPPALWRCHGSGPSVASLQLLCNTTLLRFPFPKHLPNQAYLQVDEWNSEGNDFPLRIGSGCCDPFPWASAVPMRCCKILLKPVLEWDSLISQRVVDRSLKHQSRNGSYNENSVNAVFPTFFNRDDMKQTITLHPTVPHKWEFRCKNINLQKQYLP